MNGTNYTETGSDGDDDRTNLLPPTNTFITDNDEIPIGGSLIKPITWAALAYSGFLWWASACEQGNLMADKRERTQEMLETSLALRLSATQTKPKKNGGSGRACLRRLTRLLSHISTGSHLCSSRRWQRRWMRQTRRKGRIAQSL
ncbi:hypothetical protein H2199_009021 [Coniosporium tulheliwenetii]|uniref:Uncharacterized protein n=1 Tax=Coniosporium tulheliwenetii TaxID=3383036 RepID=A0ACC2YGX4_9PEZI|nr:hypothetical protein H2199_009021 [Cladosporium sp. JES 115]